MKKVLIITYYWPPSGGSGVQRWLYFAKYLPEYGIEPIVLTVDEKKASYKVIDHTLSEKVSGIKVFRTNTLEPLKLYSKILSGDTREAIPNSFVGEKTPGLFQKISRFVRGNFFIPDARVGWCRYAYKKAKEIISSGEIDAVITTGPPHSTHLIGLKLKKNFGITWVTDFRDPWSEIHYNQFLYRTNSTIAKDKEMEKNVLETCDAVLTIGPSMKDLLAKKISGPEKKTFFVYNGFDKEMFTGVQPVKDKDHFTITHIGILGDSQPIISFLKAIKLFFDRQDEITRFLKFKIVGRISPSHVNDIKSLLPKLNFEINEYVPHKEAIQHLLNADLLLNSLAETENTALLVSGKLMEYMASGNPVLCLGNPEGDAAHLLKNSSNAAVIPRKDIDAIFFFIEKIFRQWRNNAPQKINPEVQQYSRKETTRQLAELLRVITAKK